MSVRRLAAEQPQSFEFSTENRQWADKQISKYPADRKASAVIPLLWQAQKQHDGWLPEPAIRHVAEMLDMAYIRVLEVATFYTMFNLEPVGRHFVQLCGTTPCWLRGAGDLREVCKRVIGPEKTVSADGEYSWLEVECLGACVNAPMVQINDDFYEDLDPEKFEDLLCRLKAGEAVTPGSQSGRETSAPQGGPLVLTTEGPYDGVRQADYAGTKAEPVTPAVEPEPVKPVGTSKPVTPVTASAVPKPETKQADAAVKPAPVAAAPESKQAETKPAAANNTPAQDEEVDGEQPDSLTEARDGGADDLKRIKGVGPKIEGILHSLGYFHFDQIAAWTPANVAWVDERLRFKGRIGRENWIAQAKELAAGDDKTGGQN